MKKFRSMFMLMVLAACTCSSFAQSGYVDEYYCGFSSSEEFSEWTTFTNAADRAWTLRDEYVELWTGNGMFGMDPDANAWMISPKITVTDPSRTCVRVMIHSGLSSECLKLTMGSGTTEAEQTIVVNDWNYSLTRTQYPSYYVFDIPDGVEPGDYYFGIQGYSPAMSSYIFLYSFEVTGNELFTLSGNVTNDSGEPLQGVKVSLYNDRFKAEQTDTDAGGGYVLQNISSGTYTIELTKENHESVKEEIVVDGSPVSKDFVMTYQFRSYVSGTVVDAMQRPVADAQVSVNADQSYLVNTDASGQFRIDGIKAGENYTYRVEKDLKKPCTGTFSITDSPAELGTLVMETNVVSPRNICADVLQDGTFVSWMMPLREQELRYDNGNYGGQTGFQSGEKTAIGVKFAQPVILNGIKWVTTSDYKEENVTLIVYALDGNGNITDNVLFEADNVPTLKYDFDGNVVWNEYYLDQPLEADLGCLVVVAGNTLYMANDLGDDPNYPFSYQYYLSNDYENDEFVNPKLTGNILLRGTGYVLGIPKYANGRALASKAAYVPMESAAADGVVYDLWRLTEEQFANAANGMDGWTALADGTEELCYYDRGFKSLAQGNYYYALRAVYEDGAESEISYSDVVENRMYASVVLKVSSGYGYTLTDGALVSLQNTGDDNISYTASVNDGTASFDRVKKGRYSVRIEKKGFETIDVELDFSSNDSYEASYEMSLVPEAPVALKAEQCDNDTVVISWNDSYNLYEDFESMEDFEINPSGDLGWSYVDADGVQTYELAEVTVPFENMGEPMAFMVFNPSKTQPDLFKYVRPHSGDKVLVDIAIDQSFAGGKHNDDYMFSPELNFEEDFSFSFYAIAGYGGLVAGNESFMAGYTTGSTSTEDVIWFEEEPQEVGGSWTRFSYQVPADARRVVIRCVSDNKFMFAVDDISIGYETSIADELASYDVYVDEELVARTSTNRCKISGLSDGDHIARIQAVYTSLDGTKAYSDARELIFSVDRNGIVSGSVADAFVYDGDGRNIVLPDAASDIDIFDMQGKYLGHYAGVSEVNVAHLDAGVYLVRVSTSDRSVCHKIVVR